MNLEKYLDLGDQPLANDYRSADAVGTPNWDRFPLQVNVCKSCWHSQLSVTVDPDLLFKNYLYVSGTTETFRKHTQELAEHAIIAWLFRDLEALPKRKLRVLDIACNDGTQLEAFRNRDCEVFGVDPAENLLAITREKELPVLPTYWRGTLGRELAAGHALLFGCGEPKPMRFPSRFDIITATNVFAHVNDPYDFLVGCKHVLDERGVVIIEFPYGKTTLEKCEFDQVYHEHLSYFTVNSFWRLAERAGFAIQQICETPIHGGSIRFVLKHLDVTQKALHTCDVYDFSDAEKKAGLYNIETYQQFQGRVDQNMADLREAVEIIVRRGDKPVGYGASAKLNTALNYAGVDLAYVVDDNPLKWNHLTPGRAIPIVSPQELANEPGQLAILLGAWNFKEEILKKVRAIRGERSIPDMAYVYVPAVYGQAI